MTARRRSRGVSRRSVPAVPRRLGAAALLCVACGTGHPGHPDARAQFATPDHRPMTLHNATPDATSQPAATGSVAAVAEYLRTVAAALAAPTATPDAVLVAAGARDTTREPFYIRFRPPLAGLGAGAMQLDRADPRRAPEVVTFRPEPAPDGAGPGGAPSEAIAWRALAAALGPWERGPGGPNWHLGIPVRFDSLGARYPALGRATVEVEFLVRLTRSPDDPATRVREIGVYRTPAD